MNAQLKSMLDELIGKARVRYQDPCGCLLWRAIMRTHKPAYCEVVPGTVAITSKKNADAREFRYDSFHELHLRDAHDDPTLLPMTIELK